MKAKLIFIIAIILFVSIGFFKHNFQSNTFYVAGIISASLVCIYFIFDAIKKPISSRLGTLHSILTTLGLMLLAFNIHSLIVAPIDATTNAQTFVADVKIIFKNVFGLLLFMSAQIMFLLAITKRKR